MYALQFLDSKFNLQSNPTTKTNLSESGRKYNDGTY